MVKSAQPSSRVQATLDTCPAHTLPDVSIR
jgi:hypothetical protein